jgi:K+-sensing histidine kinase KdpD
MSTGDSGQTPSQDAISVAWTDVVRFLRQLSHDLRNHLNAVELQSAFLAELATEPDLKDEIRRLRKMVSDCGSVLQKLSIRLNPPSLNINSYRASDFVDDLRGKIGTEFPKQADAVTWKTDTQDANMATDPLLMQEALLEVFSNAFENHKEGASLSFIARTEGDTLVFTLYEPKAQFDLPTDNWGREPLRYVNRGHYGLGLNRARTIIEGHGGKIRAHYDPGESKLITNISLPLSGPS